MSLTQTIRSYRRHDTSDLIPNYCTATLLYGRRSDISLSTKAFCPPPQDVPLYDAIQGLQYLDMVIQESLRLYPPAGRQAD